MQKSPIEWVANFNEDGTFTEGYTVNPIRFRPHGAQRLTTMCQKVSPGCTHCYAATIVQRFWPLEANVDFPGYTAQGIASGDFVLDNKQLESILKITAPAKVFWGDMTDIFQESISFGMIDCCFAICALTPHLTHMFLTKRPERMLEYIQSRKHEPNSRSTFNLFAEYLYSLTSTNPKLARKHGVDPLRVGNDVTHGEWKKWWPMPNVMLGTSAENQKYYDERIGYLDKLAYLKWTTYLSLEPLIGPIDVQYPKSMFPDGPPMCCNGVDCGCQGMPTEPPVFYGTRLVIVGGESGPGANPMQTSWAADIQRACAYWKIPFFFKQQGMWIDAGCEEFGKFPTGRIVHCNSEGRVLSDDEVKVSTEDSDVTTMKWVGRERAGKTLYGKTYHEFPG